MQCEGRHVGDAIVRRLQENGKLGKRRGAETGRKNSTQKDVA